MTGTLIFAHRGANKEAAENTRTAFDRALEYAIDGIETDVQLSRRDEVACGTTAISASLAFLPNTFTISIMHSSRRWILPCIILRVPNRKAS
jgi:hypothetical protein